MKAKILETNRLLLTPLNLTFLSYKYVQWMNNPLVYRFLETGGNYTLELLREYLLEVEKKDIHFWAILLKSNNKHIGNIKIDPINEKHNTGEYGIMIGDVDEWGKGYAKEASERVINECFKELKIRKITLGLLKPNKEAFRLYENLGFETEGILKQQCLFEGTYVDVIKMGLLKENWIK
jgi:ribosomal-protein-alanine N-acetyltransferase